jgi:hypothetical protein
MSLHTPQTSSWRMIPVNRRKSGVWDVKPAEMNEIFKSLTSAMQAQLNAGNVKAAQDIQRLYNKLAMQTGLRDTNHMMIVV